MENVTFSIIIPTYNRAASIGKALDSVLSQSVASWEIIVVDDGSSDTTGLVIMDYLADKRINYFKQENRGVSAARNFGAQQATGAYFIFLDSDDTLANDCLENVVKVLPSNPDLIKGAVAFENGKATRIEKATWKHKLFNGHTTLFLAGSFCIKRELFFSVGRYDERMNFSENTELSMRVYQRNPVEVVLSTVFFHYSMANDNDNRNLPNKIASHIYILKKHKLLYQAKGLYSRQYYLIAKRLFLMNKNFLGTRMLRKAYSLNPFNLYPILFYIKRKLAKV